MPDFLQQNGFIQISRDLQFRVCNPGEPRGAIPHTRREGEPCLQRGEEVRRELEETGSLWLFIGWVLASGEEESFFCYLCRACELLLWFPDSINWGFCLLIFFFNRSNTGRNRNQRLGLSRTLPANLRTAGHLLASCHLPKGAVFELLSWRVRCSGPLGGSDLCWLSGDCALRSGCSCTSPRGHSEQGKVRATWGTLSSLVTAVTRGGECWWLVLSLAGGLGFRKDASHSVGFIVKAVKVSPFSPFLPAFEASRSRAQVGTLWAHCSGKASCLSPGPRWSGRCSQSKNEGGE